MIELLIFLLFIACFSLNVGRKSSRNNKIFTEINNKWINHTSKNIEYVDKIKLPKVLHEKFCSLSTT